MAPNLHQGTPMPTCAACETAATPCPEHVVCPTCEGEGTVVDDDRETGGARVEVVCPRCEGWALVPRGAAAVAPAPAPDHEAEAAEALALSI